MTFFEIENAAQTADHAFRSSDLGMAVLNLLNRAEINADDTIYVEKAATPHEFDRIALATLSELLAYSDDKAAVAWFTARGVRF